MPAPKPKRTKNNKVLAPVDGTVEKINTNPTTNLPGVRGQGLASYIVVKQNDGIMVLLAHVDEINVKKGDTVKAGQVIAKVGNNGQSRHPHIHIGAWKDKTPQQIRFDQKAAARLLQNLAGNRGK